MSKLHMIYQRLRAVGDPSVDHALAAALPTADPRAIQLITLTILERHNAESQISLIHHFHRLPEDLQQQVVRQVTDLYRPLREAAGANNEQTRTNVVSLVARSRAAPLAYLVIEQLRQRSPELRRAAAGCLLEMADWIATRSRPLPSRSATATHGGPHAGVKPHGDAAAAGFFQSALGEALESFTSHQQVAVLLALARLVPRPMPDIARRLLDERNSSLETLRRLLEEADDPSLRQALVWFVQIPTIREAALRGMSQSALMGRASDLVPLCHLLIDCRVPPLLTKAHDAAAWLPPPEQLDSMASHELRSLPQWIRCLPIAPIQQVQKLASLARVVDTPTRLSVLRHLMQLSRSHQVTGANAVVAEFCEDGDPQIARIALRHLTRMRWEGLPQLLLKLVNTPHAEIREIASEELAPLGFERLWGAWSRLSHARRLAAARALIKIDRHFHRQLGARLAQKDRETRMRALAMIHLLNQGCFFEEALTALLKEPDDRVASAAVRALGTCKTPQAVDALRQALDHRDSRVRANAIEALHDLDSCDHMDHLTRMAQEESNRPRANALAVLMQLNATEAMGSLLKMLADPRPEQRISALWLIDHLSVVEVARHVAEMSISDADVAVKHRAGSVVQRLIGAMAGTANEHDTVKVKAP